MTDPSLTRSLPSETKAVGIPADFAAPLPDSYDDMHDTPAELSRYPALAPALTLCSRIATVFDGADARAIQFQNRHRWITRGAALLGTLAVGCAILGLSQGYEHLWEKLVPNGKELEDVVELLFATSAIVIVGLGYKTHCKENWLRWRHIAESCRLLRYKLLIHPSIWLKSREESEAWVESRLDQIRATSLGNAVEEPSPHGPFEGTQIRLPRETLRSLTEYYLFKRLNPQKEYLANRTQRNEVADRLRSYLPLFFFFSIFVVILKFAFREVGLWKGLLGCLAALLPAAAAGVRTWRSAFEFSRNKGRFESAHGALRDLENRLVSEGFSAMNEKDANSSLTAGEVYAQPVLEDLSWCEHILETEHREWLRLMYDTEWFG